jgi:uncharacterized hydantoinase/oxoprolinase family protein
MGLRDVAVSYDERSNDIVNQAETAFDAEPDFLSAAGRRTARAAALDRTNITASYNWRSHFRLRTAIATTWQYDRCTADGCRLI